MGERGQGRISEGTRCHSRHLLLAEAIRRVRSTLQGVDGDPLASAPQSQEWVTPSVFQT